MAASRAMVAAPVRGMAALGRPGPRAAAGGGEQNPRAPARAPLTRSRALVPPPPALLAPSSPSSPSGAAGAPLPLVTRRQLLSASTLVALAARPAAPAAAAANEVLEVRPGGGAGYYATISAAVAASSPGGAILVYPGTYRDRVVLGTSVAISAAPGGEVCVVHETSKPYEAVLESSATGASVEGITFQHSSPSIATNYGVYVRAGDIRLTRCKLTSATGSALGVEGGSPTLSACVLSGAKRHGAAVFGDLLGESIGETLLDRCEIAGNGLDGVLGRDGANIHIRGCKVTGNGQYGVELADCVGLVEASAVRGNKKGSVLVSGSDPAALKTDNTLDTPAIEM